MIYGERQQSNNLPKAILQGLNKGCCMKEQRQTLPDTRQSTQDLGVEKAFNCDTLFLILKVTGPLCKVSNKHNSPLWIFVLLNNSCEALVLLI